MSDEPEILPDRSYPYGYWQTTTHINVLRDAMGYYGTGINIGIVEIGHPDLNQSVLSNSVNNGRITLLGNPTTADPFHATLIASILVGQSNDGYCGIAPMAKLFCVNDSFLFKEGINVLISNNVNIINVSLGFLLSTSYGDIAKFFDYIIKDTGITICKSSGNYGSTIYDEALSYSCIGVGNINDKQTLTIIDDEIDGSSSYSSGNLLPFKPDLSAPGRYAKNPFTPNLNNGGTSSSAPIVTGICALLMQAFPQDKNKPMLLKSALLASAQVLPNMTDEYSDATSEYPAFDRPYGAGMVDAIAAYTLLDDNQYKSIHTTMNMSSYTNTKTFQVYSSTISYERDIFVSLCWDQAIIYDDDNTYTNPTVQPWFHHELRLYDPSNNLVAISTYTNDRKQFIRYTPTQTGTYTIEVYKTGSPYFLSQAAIAYYIK